MPYNYSDAEIAKRVGSGKDANRSATNAKLAAAATQPPHEDDAESLAKLQQLSGDDSTGGWATNDARNDARLQLSKITGQAPEYSEARDGGGFVGSVGGVLKKLAPFVGMIPGIGMPLGAALGAGGSALGGAMSGDKFDLGKTLLAGAAGGIGGKLNAFGSHIPNAPTDALAGFGAPAAAPSSPGFLSKLGSAVTSPFKTPTGGLDMGRVIGAGAGIAGLAENHAQRGAAENMANSQLELRKQQLGMAEKAYADKQPYRNAAIQRLGAMGAAPTRGNSVYGGG